MRRAALLVLLLLAASALPADVKKHTFAGHEWTIDVPRAYAHEATGRPDANSSVTTFAPDARLDGTRPMIQVFLTTAPKDANAFAKFAAEMIDTVRRRREQWKVERSEVNIGGHTMIRYAWSGVTIPAKDGAQAKFPARGVMLIGAEGGIAFMLHTQDSESYAKETLAITEPALRTFHLAH